MILRREQSTRRGTGALGCMAPSASVPNRTQTLCSSETSATSTLALSLYLPPCPAVRLGTSKGEKAQAV